MQSPFRRYVSQDRLAEIVLHYVLAVHLSASTQEADKQTMASLLSPAHYESFAKSSQPMCIYDREENKFVELNQTMQDRVKDVPVDDISVIAASEEDCYVTVWGIPCKLRVALALDRNMSLMEMFPAQSKKWARSSDLTQLIDLASDGVWEWFPSVDFEYMSKRFWSILGYDQHDMEEIPQAWMSCLNPDDKETTLAMYEAHIKSGGESPYHAHVRYNHKEGHEVVILCRGSVIEWLPDGNPWRMLGTHTDVTSIVKKDAIEAKSVFVSRMSHEIRSPVCTILNECELLGMNSRTRVIMDTCHQLITITDDILSLKSMKERIITLVPQQTDIQALLSKCTKRHRLEAKKKKIGVKMSMGILPESLLVDVGRFNQILDNLVSNAIKYSDTGTVNIDAEYDTDTFMLAVRVSDDGKGIPLNMSTTVFEEFVQGDTTMSGAGIGLALARRYARIMEGDVCIEHSEVNSGTTMLFTSILKEPEVPQESDTSFVILIVDDMATNREILRRRLLRLDTWGMYPSAILEAADGQEALEIFLQRKGDVQLILMDCLMPILNGFDATMAIHRECERLGLEPVPVVAVTASVSPDVQEKCFKSGMKYVVTKPYSEDELNASIRSCLKK